ncbi:unnamed protein product [Ilex paraguariensis]|uniref:Uncharacterized protein n=1 Tax=Ilex paraguariensis TaxID=185542 RepID=A0ABC8RRP9_9AQUA
MDLIWVPMFRLQTLLDTITAAILEKKANGLSTSQCLDSSNFLGTSAHMPLNVILGQHSGFEDPKFEIIKEVGDNGENTTIFVLLSKEKIPLVHNLFLRDTLDVINPNSKNRTIPKKYSSILSIPFPKDIQISSTKIFHASLKRDSQKSSCLNTTNLQIDFSIEHHDEKSC